MTEVARPTRTMAYGRTDAARNARWVVVVLAVGALGLLRVNLSAKTTHYGYQLDGLRADYLAALDENSRLTVAVGQKHSVTELRDALAAEGIEMVLYDSAHDDVVRAPIALAPAQPPRLCDTVARSVGRVAALIAGTEAARARTGPAPTPLPPDGGDG
jgi:hypothetical protein